jgi:AcrR family transcriptional regulator
MTRTDGDRERTPRQRQLMDVAARLFAERGYHAVGINDLSGEMGLTGPAFYRHFPSKDDLLVALLDEAISRHLEDMLDVVATVKEPRARLELIARHHVQFVFDKNDAIRVWRNDYASVPEFDKHRLRYLQRLYTDQWVKTLRTLRPELKKPVAEALCQAAIALAQSPTTFKTTLARLELEPLLVDSILKVLLPAEG